MAKKTPAAEINPSAENEGSKKADDPQWDLEDTQQFTDPATPAPDGPGIMLPEGGGVDEVPVNTKKSPDNTDAPAFAMFEHTPSDHVGQASGLVHDGDTQPSAPHRVSAPPPVPRVKTIRPDTPPKDPADRTNEFTHKRRRQPQIVQGDGNSDPVPNDRALGRPPKPPDDDGYTANGSRKNGASSGGGDGKLKGCLNGTLKTVKSIMKWGFILTMPLIFLLGAYMLLFAESPDEDQAGRIAWLEEELREKDKHIATLEADNVRLEAALHAIDVIKQQTGVETTPELIIVTPEPDAEPPHPPGTIPCAEQDVHRDGTLFYQGEMTNGRLVRVETTGCSGSPPVAMWRPYGGDMCPVPEKCLEYDASRVISDGTFSVLMKRTQECPIVERFN